VLVGEPELELWPEPELPVGALVGGIEGAGVGRVEQPFPDASPLPTGADAGQVQLKLPGRLVHVAPATHTGGVSIHSFISWQSLALVPAYPGAQTQV